MAEDKPLLDELRADSYDARVCTVCTWIISQPNAETWDAAFQDSGIGPAAIYRGMKKRGYRFTKSPVETHRRDKHRG